MRKPDVRTRVGTRLTNSPHPGPLPAGEGIKNHPLRPAGLNPSPFALPGSISHPSSRGAPSLTLRPVGLHLSPFAPWEKGRDEGTLYACPYSCLNFRKAATFKGRTVSGLSLLADYAMICLGARCDEAMETSGLFSFP